MPPYNGKPRRAKDNCRARRTRALLAEPPGRRVAVVPGGVGRLRQRCGGRGHGGHGKGGGATDAGCKAAPSPAAAHVASFVLRCVCVGLFRRYWRALSRLWATRRRRCGDKVVLRSERRGGCGDLSLCLIGRGGAVGASGGGRINNARCSQHPVVGRGCSPKTPSDGLRGARTGVRDQGWCPTALSRPASRFQIRNPHTWPTFCAAPGGLVLTPTTSSHHAAAIGGVEGHCDGVGA